MTPFIRHVKNTKLQEKDDFRIECDYKNSGNGFLEGRKLLCILIMKLVAQNSTYIRTHEAVHKRGEKINLLHVKFKNINLKVFHNRVICDIAKE